MKYPNLEKEDGFIFSKPDQVQGMYFHLKMSP
jgi:hypothetical protein